MRIHISMCCSGAQLTLVRAFGGIRKLVRPAFELNQFAATFKKSLRARVVLYLPTAYRHSKKNKYSPWNRRSGAFCNLNKTHCIYYGLCAHKKGTSQFAISCVATLLSTRYLWGNWLNELFFSFKRKLRVREQRLSVVRTKVRNTTYVCVFIGKYIFCIAKLFIHKIESVIFVLWEHGGYLLQLELEGHYGWRIIFYLFKRENLVLSLLCMRCNNELLLGLKWD